MGGILLKDSRYPERFHTMSADHITKTPQFIDNDHSYIHQGNAYGAWYYQATSGTTQLVFLLTTPLATVDRRFVHFRPVQISTDSPLVTVKILEGTTYTAGTAIALINRNRNSNKVSGCTLTHSPTGSVGTTTQIEQYFIGGGTGQGQTKSGDTINGIHEMILKPATKYAITVDFGTAATKIGISFFHYEEYDG